MLARSLWPLRSSTYTCFTNHNSRNPVSGSRRNLNRIMALPRARRQPPRPVRHGRPPCYAASATPTASSAKTTEAITAKGAPWKPPPRRLISQRKNYQHSDENGDSSSSQPPRFDPFWVAKVLHRSTHSALGSNPCLSRVLGDFHLTADVMVPPVARTFGPSHVVQSSWGLTPFIARLISIRSKACKGSAR